MSNWLVAVPLSLATASCRTPNKDEGDLAAVARRARAQGKTRASTNLLLEYETPYSFENTLRQSSMIVVTAVRSSAQQSQTKDGIITWHVLRVLETLWTAPEAPYGCDLGRKLEIVLNPDEVALPAVGGTAVVDGVEVTMVSNESSIAFKAGERYLLLSAICSNRTAGLLRGPFDIFSITPEDEVVIESRPHFILDDMRPLCTLERLRAHLQEKARP